MMIRNLILLSLLAWQFASADITETADATESTIYVALDTETTGLNPAVDRIVEIGLVKFKDGVITDRKVWLLDPQYPIGLIAESIHGINDEMIAAKPVFEEIYPELRAFIKGSTLIAHNAPFDTNFLKAEVARIEGAAALDNPVHCSLKLSRAWFPNQASYKLSELVKFFELKDGGYHRALADAEHVSHLFIHATDDLGCRL